MAQQTYKQRLETLVKENAPKADAATSRMLMMGLMFVSEDMAKQIVESLDDAVSAYRAGDNERILAIADKFNARPIIQTILTQQETANADS